MSVEVRQYNLMNLVRKTSPLSSAFKRVKKIPSPMSFKDMVKEDNFPDIETGERKELECMGVEIKERDEDTDSVPNGSILKKNRNSNGTGYNSNGSSSKSSSLDGEDTDESPFLRDTT